MTFIPRSRWRLCVLLALVVLLMGSLFALTQQYTSAAQIGHLFGAQAPLS